MTKPKGFTRHHGRGGDGPPPEQPLESAAGAGVKTNLVFFTKGRAFREQAASLGVQPKRQEAEVPMEIQKIRASWNPALQFVR